MGDGCTFAPFLGILCNISSKFPLNYEIIKNSRVSGVQKWVLWYLMGQATEITEKRIF
jgi:hypothetical protein